MDRRATRTKARGGVTFDAWDPLGRLCNVSTASSTPCGSTPATGTAYTYNGDGLRMSATTSSTVTDSTWDSVTGSSIPLTINDAATTGSSTTNTSYLYGDLLFGGVAPIEQIVTTGSGASASYLVASPQGVQGVFSASGASLEQALYSPYGVPTITSGTTVTPFGFQGSYTDPTGLIYLISRYYDPTTDQFLSVDPLVDETGQPYVFTNDNPLSATDPLGLEVNNIGPNGNPSEIAVHFGDEPTSAGPGTGDSLGSGTSSEESTSVSDILKDKKGSIKNAKLPPGSPSWDEIQKMTMDQIDRGAAENKPGYKTIKKLLTDKRYNK